MVTRVATLFVQQITFKKLNEWQKSLFYRKKLISVRDVCIQLIPIQNKDGAQDMSDNDDEMKIDKDINPNKSFEMLLFITAKTNMVKIIQFFGTTFPNTFGVCNTNQVAAIHADKSVDRVFCGRIRSIVQLKPWLQKFNTYTEIAQTDLFSFVTNTIDKTKYFICISIINNVYIC